MNEPNPIIEDAGVTGWSMNYWGVRDLEPEPIMSMARGWADYHAKELNVPVEEIHAYWNYDYPDPLADCLTLGWRSDWGSDCKNRCNLHKEGT